MDETPSLQYTIEREAAGYKEGHLGHLGTVAALQHFKQTQRSYRSFRVRSTVKVRLNAFFPRLAKYSWDGWDVCSDVLVSRVTGENIIGILSLKRFVAETNRLNIITVDIPGLFMNYWVDRSQDLLVVFTGKQMQFLRLQDGKKHDKVKPPSTEPLTIYLSNCSPLFICGDWMLVGQLSPVVHDAFDVYLYHWPSGQSKQVCYSYIL